MNRKQLTLVVLLGLVLGGLGLWMSRRDAATYQTTGPGLGQKLLPEFPINDIALIRIQQGTNDLTVVRDQEIWKVKERYHYPANFTEVGDFLRKLWDLKVVQSEPIGESQLARLQLLEPGPGTNTATKVTFQDASGKTLTTLLLGKSHQRRSDDAASPFGGGYADGRWLLVPAAQGPKTAALVSESFSQIEPKPDRWLNKDFFKVEKIKSIEVTHTQETNSWKVYRDTEGGELRLADLKPDEKLDASKASPVGNALSWPSFVDVAAPDLKPEETGLNAPTVARIETFDGFQYTARIGTKTTNDNYYFQIQVAANFPKERTAPADEKPEDKERLDKEFKEKLGKQEEKLKQEKDYEPWTFLVSKWTIDALLKERKDLLATEKKGDAANTKATEPDPAGGIINPLEPPKDDGEPEDPADEDSDSGGK